MKYKIRACFDRALDHFQGCHLTISQTLLIKVSRAGGQHDRLNLGQTLTGRAVVDIDVAEGKPGEITWEALSADQDVPKTLAYRAGRGGLQMVFRLPDGETGGKAGG
ncbi:hypothetical protein ACFV16_18215 [Streptomyces massasporeus]|uniref:hypothetical protein n=1 Tax=Streptomyces massasporeus TaxID=67324 RepID=UPI0036CE5B59